MKRSAQEEAAGAPHQKVPGFVVGGGKNVSMTKYYSPKGGTPPLGRLGGTVSVPHIVAGNQCRQVVSRRKLLSTLIKMMDKKRTKTQMTLMGQTKVILLHDSIRSKNNCVCFTQMKLKYRN